MRVGTDEAGKGPVLGSMFAAAVGVPDPSVLPEDVGDSKGIAPERRQAIAARLDDDDRVTVGVAAIPVDRIDDPETDMNSLTVAAHAEAIDDALGVSSGDNASGEKSEDDALGDGSGSDTPTAQVLADAGDTSEQRFARRVEAACEVSVEIDARHGADEDDPVVGAASIVAKVRRDRHVREIDAAHDRSVGSGYPSDPTTREFLEAYASEHGNLPDCTRRSWSTAADVLAEAQQSGLGEF